MCHVYVCCLQRSEESIRAPGTGARDGREPLTMESESSTRATSICNCWAISPAPGVTVYNHNVSITFSARYACVSVPSSTGGRGLSVVSSRLFWAPLVKPYLKNVNRKPSVARHAGL